MKLSSRLVAACLVSFYPLAAQETPEAAPKAESNVHQQAFLNLPQKEREDFSNIFTEAQRLFSQKRIFEALDKLADAEKIFADHPDLHNLRGACQVEFRAFDKAMEHFRKADELQPGSPNIIFNIGEIQFVTKDWKACEETFTRVLDMVKDDPKQLPLARLVEFKILLSRLKLGKEAEATEMAGKYDFLDDSPYPYYAEAALHYHAGREIEAEAAIARATRIFQNPAILSPWQDTMIEFGYIKSFFGSLEEESDDE